MLVRMAKVRRHSAKALLCILILLVVACGAPEPPASTRSTAVPPPRAAEATGERATPTNSVAQTQTTQDTTASAIGELPTVTAAATAMPSPTTVPPTATPMFGARETVPEDLPAFGAVAHLYYVDRPWVLEQARAGGFEWVRQQIPWKDTERQDRFISTEELDRIVAAVQASGRKLLLSLVKSPDFLTSGPGDNGLPNNPEDFGRFAGEIAQRYKGRVHAIEVWNEQNLAVENGGHVVPEDAGHYVEVLKAGYQAIKAVDPEIIVVAGALSSTGVTQPDIAVDDLTYLQAMYAYNDGEIRNYMDAQGFHPASTLNPPQYKFGEDPGPRPEGCEGGCWQDAPTHYFRHIENFIQIMYNSGMGDKPIWITEMGWATQNTTPGYEYGNFVTAEQQAAYLTGALERIVFRYDEWVDAVFIWNLNFGPLWGANGDPLHEQAAFSLLGPEGNSRPSFVAVQQFIEAVQAGRVPESATSN
jgi:polysaccharide biosynthesis protein PslG